jgi:hypothetical protein
MISVVYATAGELERSWSRISEEYMEKCSHLKLIPYVTISDDERAHAYPINKMRNIGLDQVTTSHILVIDVDFIPSTGLDRSVQKAIDAVKEEARYALVVPAYERQLKSSPCEDLEGCLQLLAQDPEFIPKSMASLTECVNENKCIVFHSDHFAKGHGNTNSEQCKNNLIDRALRRTLASSNTVLRVLLQGCVKWTNPT